MTAIRQILAEIGLFPEEGGSANPYPGLHSVRLSLPASLGSYGTNGKGSSVEYGLASAYAEFMERMQNAYFHRLCRTMVASFRERYGFYYAPDERYLTEEQLLALPGDVASDLCRGSARDRETFMHEYYARPMANDAPGIVAVPFYDTAGQDVVYLPLNLLLQATTSNGMAAGNTLPEAIFQASCELLERWAAAEVLFGRLTPPTVPRSYLLGFSEEFAIVEAIERTGKYRVTVKDFSCGARIPALGLIVENRQAGTYRLNVGCDTSFQVALSRCLTEVYQGLKDEDEFDRFALPIPTEEPAYFACDDVASRCERAAVFFRFTKDGRGPYPAALFGEQASYPFAPDVWVSAASFEEEVRRLVAFFRSRGYNVYIRDASFLGFPSVQVYVPGMSAIGYGHIPAPGAAASPLMVALDTIEARALKLKHCSDQDLAVVAEVLERLPSAASLVDVFAIELKGSSPWRQLSLGFVLTMIYYRLAQYEKAGKSLGRFLEARPDKYRYGYYDKMRQYLARRAEGLTHRQAAELLAQDPDWGEVGRQMAEEMADSRDIFRFVKLPNCPDCEGCDLHPDCVTTGILSTVEKVYPAMHRGRVDQTALAWVNSPGQGQETRQRGEPRVAQAQSIAAAERAAALLPFCGDPVPESFQEAAA